MLEIFVFGSFWFWVIVCLELVALFAFVEFENGIAATISLLVFAACLQFLGDINIISYIANNPWATFGLIAAYFLIGTTWGTIKWWLYCSDRLEQYNERREEFLRGRGEDVNQPVPSHLREEWKRVIGKGDRSPFSSETLADPPLAKNHKSDIIRWMSFWFISVVWTFVNDFVKRVFTRIYRNIALFLQSLSDNMFNKSTINEDFADD